MPVFYKSKFYKQNEQLNNEVIFIFRALFAISTLVLICFNNP